MMNRCLKVIHNGLAKALPSWLPLIEGRPLQGLQDLIKALGGKGHVS